MLALELLNLLRQVAIIDQSFESAVLDNHAQFGGCKTGVERDENDSRLARCKESIQEFHAVHCENANPVALYQAALIEPKARATNGAVIELAVGEYLLSGDVDESGALRAQARALTEDVAVDHEILKLSFTGRWSAPSF